MLKIKHKRIWLIILIFFLFIILVIPASVNIPYKTFFSDLFQSPLFLSSFLLRELKAIILYRATFNENSRLKKEITTLREQLIKSQEALQENERLHKLLSFKSELTFPATIASVIGRDASNWSSSLIIDKGSKDKIKEGMPVISNNSLVGRIQEVGRNTSRVILINDPNVSVAATLQRSRQDALVSGTLSGDLIMRYLNRNSDIQIGDLVLTSSISSVFPKEIPIGKVSSLGQDPGGLSDFALIAPSVNLMSIEDVLVVLKND